MKKLFWSLLVLVLVLVGVAVALPFLLPREMIKAEVERRLSAELRREVRIEGSLELRPWRPFALTLADIHVANPDWAGEPTLARIARLDLEVDALAYFGGTVALERLLIEQPTLALEIREDGTPSWQFATDPPRDEAAGDGGGGQGQSELPTIRIGEIRLTEGTVGILDHGTGEARSFTDLELWARGEPDDPANGAAGGEAVKLDGSVTSGGERATLNAVIGDFNGLLAGEPSSLTLDVAAPGLGIAANGEAAPSGSAVLALTADASPRVLLDWLGQPVALPEGRFETSTFSVDLAASPSGVAFRAFTLEIDDLALQGDLEMDLADRPSVTGRIDLGDLDLRPYLPATEPGTAAGGSPDEEGATSAEEDPDSNAGWPDEPLDLPLPLPVDLDVDVRFASLLARGFEFGEGAAALTADAESVGAEITGLDLFDGRMTGAVTLTNGDPLGLDARAEISDVQLRPLLDATADIDRLTGIGNVQFSLTSAGDSVDALIRDLDGEGQVLTRDGAIIGINIGATMRQVMTLGAASAAAEPQRTDFAEAGGSFTIEDGVLDNQDFSLNAPVLRVSGNGTVDLGEQTLAYRLLPRLAATLDGQEASGDAAFQAGVPLVVEGPWADPSINLDLGGMLSGDISDPAALAETVRDIAGDPAMLENLGESLGIDPGSSLGRALEGLGGILGGGRQTPAEGEQNQPADDPAGRMFEGLGDLLRR